MSERECLDECSGKRKSGGVRRIEAEEKKKKEDELISKLPKLMNFFPPLQAKGINYKEWLYIFGP